ATLKELGYEGGLYPSADYVAVKVPVFSFEKLHNVDTHLGPEMKSTGEVLGIAKTLDEALYKGLVAAGYKMKRKGGIFITVRDTDKQEIIAVADKFSRMGFEIYATAGTANTLNKNMIAANVVRKIHEDPENNTLTLLDSGKIDYVISTSAKGRLPARDSVKIRRRTVEHSIACLTSIDTANALADCLAMEKSIQDIEMVDITKI
ncbi:MAG: carbamoyl-phosphate synthase large subunit, partial [Oscillospiraceae bacterium]|nr:carbamoyl-phosphate synthase large subunit [Oscillospiraceae bacterium]